MFLFFIINNISGIRFLISLAYVHIYLLSLTGLTFKLIIITFPLITTYRYKRDPHLLAVLHPQIVHLPPAINLNFLHFVSSLTLGFRYIMFKG